MGFRVYFATGVLLVVSILNAFDRQVAMVVAEQIREQWHLDDAHVGILSGSFMLIYAVSGIPMGLLADRLRRFRFLAVGVLIWSVTTALGGLARSFGQLLGTRVAVGISESTFFPSSMSLLGDLFPPGKRNRAVGVVLIGIPVGISLSYGFGGAIAQAHGWRSAFYIALGPGILAALACLFAHEPARGASEEHDVGVKRRGSSPIRILVRIPTFWVVFATAALHMFASLAQAAFLTPFLMRYHHMNVEEAGKALGIIAGLSPIVGMLISTFVADRLLRTRRDAPMIVGFVTLLLSIPTIIVALRCTSEDRTLLLVMLALTQILTFPFISFQQTILQAVVEPSVRGTAVAMMSLAQSVLGGALGPLVVGLLSDALARRAAVASLHSESITPEMLEPFRGEGLRQALYVVPVTVALLTAIILLGTRRMRRDADALLEWMAEQGPDAKVKGT